MDCLSGEEYNDMEVGTVRGSLEHTASLGPLTMPRGFVVSRWKDSCTRG